MKEILHSLFLYLLKEIERVGDQGRRGKKDERDSDEAGVDRREREGEGRDYLHFNHVCSLQVLSSVIAQFKESNSEYSELLRIDTLSLVT